MISIPIDRDYEVTDDNEVKTAGRSHRARLWHSAFSTFLAYRESCLLLIEIHRVLETPIDITAITMMMKMGGGEGERGQELSACLRDVSLCHIKHSVGIPRIFIPIDNDDNASTHRPRSILNALVMLGHD